MPTINAWGSNIPVDLSRGGTNATSMATSTGIVKYDGTSLVTSSTAKIDASNIYTNTSQPRFSYSLSSTVNDVTGNGANYTIVFNNKIFETGTGFNTGTGVYTVPVAGIWLFTASVYVTGVGSSMNTLTVSFATTAQTYNNIQTRAAGSTLDFIMPNVTALCAMSASDTASVVVNLAGGPGNTADIFGAAGLYTYFQGVLIS